MFESPERHTGDKCTCRAFCVTEPDTSGENRDLADAIFRGVCIVGVHCVRDRLSRRQHSYWAEVRWSETVIHNECNQAHLPIIVQDWRLQRNIEMQMDINCSYYGASEEYIASGPKDRS